MTPVAIPTTFTLAFDAALQPWWATDQTLPDYQLDYFRSSHYATAVTPGRGAFGWPDATLDAVAHLTNYSADGGISWFSELGFVSQEYGIAPDNSHFAFGFRSLVLQVPGTFANPVDFLTAAMTSGTPFSMVDGDGGNGPETRYTGYAFVTGLSPTDPLPPEVIPQEEVPELPEPSTLSLACLGGLALWRSRSRSRR